MLDQQEITTCIEGYVFNFVPLFVYAKHISIKILYLAYIYIYINIIRTIFQRL